MKDSFKLAFIQFVKLVLRFSYSRFERYWRGKRRVHVYVHIHYINFTLKKLLYYILHYNYKILH